MDFTELRHLAEQIETECGKAIIGKGEQIRLVLTSLFAGGHVLIDDIPGVGKTTLVKALSAVLGCGMVRVQFTPDLLPSDIVGMNIYSQKTGEMVFTPGPIMTNILLADEPVASLDPVTGRQILCLLRDIQRQRGVSILMNSHNLDLSLEFSTHIVGMNRGRVVFDGAPGDVTEVVLRDIYGEAAAV